MRRFLVGTVINGAAIWLTTAIIPAITLQPYGGTTIWHWLGSLLLIGAIFGFVNAVIAPVIKVLALPLYLLTFGLISLAINGFVLIFVTWLSNLIKGGGLAIAGFGSDGLSWQAFGWAVLGAIVLSLASFVTRWVFRITRIL